MQNAPISTFALARALDDGHPTAWSVWLRDLLHSHGGALESEDHAHAQSIRAVTVHAGPRDAPSLVEDRRGHTCTRGRPATERPVESIRAVLHCQGETIALNTPWYPTGPHNALPLDSPCATLPSILMTHAGALDRALPGRIARLLTEPAPEDAEPCIADRLLALARQLAPIVIHAGTADETRAARAGVLEVYLEGRLRGLDTSARKAMSALLGEDVAQLVATRKGARTATLRSVTLKPSSPSEQSPHSGS